VKTAYGTGEAPEQKAYGTYPVSKAEILSDFFQPIGYERSVFVCGHCPLPHRQVAGQKAYSAIS
jgi:hypothetical protein